MVPGRFFYGVLPMESPHGDTPHEGAMRAFLLYANLPVGVIAVCFVLVTYALLGLPPSLPLLLLAFCAVFLVYQVERSLAPAPEDAFNHFNRLAWVAGHRGYVWVSTTLAVGGTVATLPWLRSETFAAGVVLALGSGLYMVPVGPRRLKSVWYLKPLLISGAWAVGGVLLPVLEAGTPVTAGVVALVGYRLLFVLPNALLADWPDRAGDTKAGLVTVATRYPAEQLRRLSVAVLLLALGGGLVAMVVYEAWLLAVDLVGLLVMLVVVGRPWPQTRWFFGFVLDLVVAWPVMTAVSAWLLDR